MANSDSGVGVGMFVIAVLAGTLGLGIGGCLGENKGRNAVIEQAIEHNAAEWTVDPRTGGTEILWKGQKNATD